MKLYLIIFIINTIFCFTMQIVFVIKSAHVVKHEVEENCSLVDILISLIDKETEERRLSEEEGMLKLKEWANGGSFRFVENDGNFKLPDEFTELSEDEFKTEVNIESEEDRFEKNHISRSCHGFGTKGKYGESEIHILDSKCERYGYDESHYDTHQSRLKSILKHKKLSKILEKDNNLIENWINYNFDDRATIR